MVLEDTSGVNEQLLDDTQETLQEQGPTRFDTLVDELQRSHRTVEESQVKDALRILASNNKVVHTKDHRIRATNRR